MRTVAIHSEGKVAIDTEQSVFFFRKPRPFESGVKSGSGLGLPFSMTSTVDMVDCQKFKSVNGAALALPAVAFDDSALQFSVILFMVFLALWTGLLFFQDFLPVLGVMIPSVGAFLLAMFGVVFFSCFSNLLPVLCISFNRFIVGIGRVLGLEFLLRSIVSRRVFGSAVQDRSNALFFMTRVVICGASAA